MRDLLDLLLLAGHLAFVAFGICLLAFGLLITWTAYLALLDRIDRRKAARAALRDAHDGPSRQAESDPAPAPQSLATGRAALHAAITTPTAAELHQQHPEIGKEDRR